MKKALIVANMLFASATVWGMQNGYDKLLNARRMFVSNIQYLKPNNTAPQIEWTQKKWKEVIKTKKKTGKLDYFNTSLDSEGWTPFMYATKYSTYEVVKQLLKLKDSKGRRFINIDAQHGNVTALALAIYNKDTDKIKLLLRYGAEVYRNHLSGLNAEDLVCVMRDTPSAFIIQNQINNNLELVSCAYFSKARDVYEVKKLIESGAYINYQINRDYMNDNNKKNITESAQGMTPLISVIKSPGEKRNVILDLLLTHPDVDVNLKDVRGWTPLFYAIQREDLETVKKLLTFKGAAGKMFVDLNEKAPNGVGAMDLIVSKAVYTKNSVEIENYATILRELIRMGLDCSKRSKAGMMLLMEDNIRRLPNILKVFLQEKNKQKNKQILGLIDAGRHGNKLFDIDIDRWIAYSTPLDINDQNNDFKHTALIGAVEAGQEESTRLLLSQNNIQIYLKDIFGHSALWYATTLGYENLTEMLLKNYDSQKLAAEIDEADAEGNTLWDYLCEEGTLSIIQSVLYYLPEDIREEKISIFKKRKLHIINAINSVVAKLKYPNQIAEPTDQVATETPQIEQKPEPVVISAQEKNRLINKGFKENVAKAIEYFNTIISEEEGSALEIKARKSYNECINDIKVLLKAKDNNEHRIVNIDLISEAALNASANGCLEILEPLITYESSSIDVKDDEGNSLLMLAAKNGHLNIIPKLMGWYKNASKNSDDSSYEKFLNQTNKHNYTALMLAAENGHEAVVKTLVEKYKVKSRDAKQASDVAQSQINNLSEKNRNGSKNKIISSYKSIKNILDIRKEEAKKNEELGIEKVEEYWPVFFSSRSKKQLLSLRDDLKYIYDEVILQLSELKISACPSTKKIEKLASGLMAIRLNDGHRLVYDIDGDEIHIISCKDHYPNKENKRSRKDVLKSVKFDTQWTNGNFVSRNEAGA